MTYEYDCVNPVCNAQWETEQRITEDPLTECPQCKQATARRLISRAAFSLVGPRWGVDGYSK